MFMGIGIILIIIATICIFYGFIEDTPWSTVLGGGLVAAGIILVVIHFNTAQGSESKETSNPYSARFERYDVRSGSLFIDKETGCQYLKGNYPESSFTSVLTAEGKPFCVR